MELKTIWGELIFAVEGAKTILEVVKAARATNKTLYRADLNRADLSGADLNRANLSGAKNNELALAMIQFIPETGPFVGWKKCRDGAIVRLGILHDAKRSHGAGRKCRCSKAKVLTIYGSDGQKIDRATSFHDDTFVYRKGEIVTTANGFDEDRWNVCGAGIHFFLTRREAEAFHY